MVPHRALTWILTACLTLASCRSFESSPPTPDPASEPTSFPAASTSSPDYVARIRNAEYQLGLADGLRIVQLTDGRFEQGTPGGVDFISVTVTEFAARGDLDGDRRDEYAALIAENYGGTGVFVFLVVFSDMDGRMTYRTAALVDDRPLLDELSIADGEIFLGVTSHKFDDPMCCPTLKTARHYRLFGSQLHMTDYATFAADGRPRTIAIETPLDGTEVFSSVAVKGSVAIAPFENNLVYRIYDLGGVELAIGSLTVNAADLGGPGVFEQTILLGNVLSGATIRLEVQDVSAEDGSLLAMDSVELVVK